MKRNEQSFVKWVLISLCCVGLLAFMNKPVFALSTSIVQSDEGGKRVLPKTKKITVVVKGEREEREATLFESALGYYMYVLPNFVASGEEPGRDILFSKADDRFSTRIEFLGTTPDQTKTLQLAETELAEIGKVVDGKQASAGNDKLDPLFAQAAFYLRAGNDQTIKEIILFQVQGVWFKVTRFMVNSEAIEGIEPSMTAMLKTIAIK